MMNLCSNDNKLIEIALKIYLHTSTSKLQIIKLYTYRKNTCT